MSVRAVRHVGSGCNGPSRWIAESSDDERRTAEACDCPGARCHEGATTTSPSKARGVRRADRASDHQTSKSQDRGSRGQVFLRRPRGRRGIVHNHTTSATRPIGTACTSREECWTRTRGGRRADYDDDLMLMITMTTHITRAGRVVCGGRLVFAASFIFVSSS